MAKCETTHPGINNSEWVYCGGVILGEPCVRKKLGVTNWQAISSEISTYQAKKANNYYELSSTRKESAPLTLALLAPLLE